MFLLFVVSYALKTVREPLILMSAGHLEEKTVEIATLIADKSPIALQL